MSQAVNHLKAQISLASGPEQLRLLVDLAFALREVDAREGLEVSRTAARLAQADRNWTALASLLLAEALNLDRLGNYPAARLRLDEAQRTNARTGDIGILARIWNARGVVCSNQGQLPEALHHYLLSEGVCEETRNTWMLCGVLNNIGIVYDRLGRHEEAFAAYGRALKLAHTIHREDIELHSVSNLGFNRMFLERWTDALHYHKEALQAAQRLENPYGVIVSTANMAETHAALGNTDLAHALFEDAIGRARDIGDLEHLVDLLHEHARLFLKSGDRPAAIALLQECLGLVEQMGGFHRDLSYRVLLAETLLADGRGNEALTSLEAAPAPAEHDGNLEARQQLYALLTQLHAQDGRPDLAGQFEQRRQEAEQALLARQASWAALVPEIERQVDRWKQDAALSGQRLQDTLPVGLPAQPGGVDLAGLSVYFDAAHRQFEDLALLVVAVEPQEHPTADPPLQRLDELLDLVPPAPDVKAVRLGRRSDGAAVLLLPNAGHRSAVAYSRHLIGHLRARASTRVSVGCCTTTAWSQAGDMLRSAERLLSQAQGLGGNRVMATGQGGA